MLMNFYDLLFSFEISAPNDKIQLILILHQCLERCNANLTVATDYTVSISVRNKRKDGDLGKRSATEINLIAVQKFLTDVTTICTKYLPRCLCDKITCI